MLDSLWDSLVSWAEALVPFEIIPEYDVGIRLRLGRYVKSLGPGIHWKFPIIDEIITTTGAVTTLDLPSQSLTTADGKTMVISGTVKYHVNDPKLFLIDIYEAADVLKDTALGLIKYEIIARDWADCLSSLEKIETDTTRILSASAAEFGVFVDPDVGFTITDIALARNIRLLQDLAYRETRTDD